ncbi:MAG TPA: hypothetical protein PLK99_06985, partial [Burkholderiales bacterium]|nr:hypothetical protein [Burkholderiales bacterium]
MSLLSRDRLRIALCPDRAIVVHFSRGKVVSKAVQPIEGDVVEALSGILSIPPAKDATLILSSHFVKFMVVPWQDEALSEEEMLAMVRHRFSEIYGEKEREIRLSEGKIGASSLASALDRDLLEGIKQAFAASGTRLRSVQPYLMTAFNASRSEIKEASCWFVVMEKDICCMAKIREGKWERLRQCRGEAEQAWLMLEREAMLAEEAGRRVYLYAPEHPGMQPGGSWSVHCIRTGIESGSHAM